MPSTVCTTLKTPSSLRKFLSERGGLQFRGYGTRLTRAHPTQVVCIEFIPDIKPQVSLTLTISGLVSVESLQGPVLMNARRINRKMLQEVAAPRTFFWDMVVEAWTPMQDTDFNTQTNSANVVLTPTFMNSPSFSGKFVNIAPDGPVQPAPPPPTTTTPAPAPPGDAASNVSDSSILVIGIGAGAGVLGLCCFGVCFCLLCTKRQKKKRVQDEKEDTRKKKKGGETVAQIPFGQQGMPTLGPLGFHRPGPKQEQQQRGWRFSGPGGLTLGKDAQLHYSRMGEEQHAQQSIASQNAEMQRQQRQWRMRQAEAAASIKTHAPVQQQQQAPAARPAYMAQPHVGRAQLPPRPQQQQQQSPPGVSPEAMKLFGHVKMAKKW